MNQKPAITPNEVNTWLRQGIAAARAGQQAQAREMLMQVIEIDEENLLAWLWLSGVVDSLEDQEVCLENVLTLQPDHEMARRGLDQIRRYKATQWLREGIAAAKAGRTQEAQDLLTRAVEADETNVSAWLWLSGVTQDLDERELYLQNVLSLDPDNVAAQHGLAHIRQQRTLSAPTSFSPSPPEPEPLWVTRSETPVTPAAAILQEDFAARPLAPEFISAEVSPSPEDSTLGKVFDDMFDDEYLCPSCAAPTDPSDRTCTTCGQPLWVRFRKQERRSKLLWLLIANEALNTLSTAMLPVVLFCYAFLMVIFHFRSSGYVLDPVTLFSAYLGLPADVPQDVLAMLLNTVPRAVFYFSFLPLMLSGFVLAGLYFRWKPVYYILSLKALLNIAGSFVLMFKTSNIFLGLLGMVMPLASFYMIFQLDDDFAWKERRILLRIDPDLAGGLDYLARGKLYTQQKMWAMAAIHFRKAIAMHPNDFDAYVALAVTYIRLGKYDYAEHQLNEAHQLAPHSSRVQQLRDLLNEIRTLELSAESPG
ncbi:MAG TPA: tetratricopeptide repeat protein [Chloroflexi bacterium]|nr:tetratricopeptide repeat protein [Chloroflexota bacterium]